MTENRSKISGCPHCGNGRLYLLGDGRAKCSDCGRKFTPGGRRPRLTADMVDAVVTGFTAGCPASEVASQTGLNLKTVQLYYGRIRELLAEERAHHLADFYGGTRVPADLFNGSEHGSSWRNAILIGCLIDRESAMDLIFAGTADRGGTADIDPENVAGWLVAADRKALERRQLDRIFCLAGRRSRERARAFWLGAKDRLSAYCGGFRSHFHLYLREIEFRNNIEDPAAARKHIGALLGQKTITSTGEEDA